MPDRGGRRRRASRRQAADRAADRAAGARAGAELRGRRASRGLCKNDIRGLRRAFSVTFRAGLYPLSGRRRAERQPSDPLAPPAGRRRRFLFRECRIGATRSAAPGEQENKATADQSPLLRLCLRRVPFQKNVYASAIGLCKDSIIMQSTKPSNSDFWRSFNM